MPMRAKGWDQVFDWWQSAAAAYLDLVKWNPFFLQWMGILLRRQLETKKWTDAALERMWRQMGLPPAEEIARLHERLNHFESRLSAWREEDRLRHMQTSPESMAKSPVSRYA